MWLPLGFCLPSLSCAVRSRILSSLRASHPHAAQTVGTAAAGLEANKARRNAAHRVSPPPNPLLLSGLLSLQQQLGLRAGRRAKPGAERLARNGAERARARAHPERSLTPNVCSDFTLV